MNPSNNHMIAACAVATAMSSALLSAHAKCNEWLPMFEGPGGRVSAMIVFNDALFVGGEFESCGAVNPNDAARFIARFDGREWSALGSGTSGGSVNALAVFNGELIVGGNFTRAGGLPAFGIARWNGREWNTMADGFGDDSGAASVHALIEFNGQLIAAGAFTRAGSQEARFIARWDGETWHALGNGIDSPVFALAVLKSQLIAGGENFIKHWDGESWSAFGGEPAVSGTVRALLVHNDRLIAGGQFAGPLGGTHHSVLSTDGSQWSPVGAEIHEDFNAGSLGEIHALLIWNGDLVAAGDLGAQSPSVARFNGTFWMPLGVVMGGSRALAVYDDSLIAAGEFEVDSNTIAYLGGYEECDAAAAADTNADGQVNIDDLMLVLGNFGVCPDTAAPCAADIWPAFGGDGIVDISDILEIINHWND